MNKMFLIIITLFFALNFAAIAWADDSTTLTFEQRQEADEYFHGMLNPFIYVQLGESIVLQKLEHSFILRDKATEEEYEYSLAGTLTHKQYQQLLPAPTGEEIEIFLNKLVICRSMFFEYNWLHAKTQSLHF